MFNIYQSASNCFNKKVHCICKFTPKGVATQLLHIFWSKITLFTVHFTVKWFTIKIKTLIYSLDSIYHMALN